MVAPKKFDRNQPMPVPVALELMEVVGSFVGFVAFLASDGSVDAAVSIAKSSPQATNAVGGPDGPVTFEVARRHLAALGAWAAEKLDPKNEQTPTQC
jgi:hypothetical protein